MPVPNRCFNGELTRLEMPPQSVNDSAPEAGEKEKKRKQEMQSFSVHSLQHFDSVGHASVPGFLSIRGWLPLKLWTRINLFFIKFCGIFSYQYYFWLWWIKLSMTRSRIINNQGSGYTCEELLRVGKKSEKTH